MKKIIVLVMATMLCATSFAQRSGRSAAPTLAQKKHAFYLGLKGGVDFTSMTQPEGFTLYDAAGTGFSAGVAAKVRFNQATPNAPAGTGLVGAGLELKYKQNTAKTFATDEKGKENADLSIGYFEVPVFVQIYPFYKSDAMNTFYLEVGPDFAGTMDRKPKMLTLEYDGGMQSQEFPIDVESYKIKGMDVRVMAGVGYDFAIKNSQGEATNLIGINARYYLGTSELSKYVKSKMNTFEVSLSWMFNVGKL